MTPMISVSDLHVMNGEPRVLDLKLAEALDFSQTYDIRKLINRNIDELNSHGEVFATMAKTPSTGGRPTQEYWLNEAQALLICMFSRTDKAADGRTEIIRVFLAWRRGELVQVRERHGQIVAEDVRSLPIMERLGLATEFRRIFGPQPAQAMWPYLDLPMPPVALEADDAGDAEAPHCLRVLLEAAVLPPGPNKAPDIDWAIEAAITGDETMRTALLACGIRVAESRREGIFVASNHPFMLELFAGTPWEDRAYIPTLASLPGAHRAPPMKFGGRSHRTVFLPAATLDAAKAFRQA